MLLTWLLWARLHAGLGDAFEAMARGARLDLACAAVAAAPIALWCTILPERAWKSRLHRAAAAAAFATGLVGIVGFLLVDALQFHVHHARLSHPLRERLQVALRLIAGNGNEGTLQVVAVTLLASLVAGLALALALRRPFRAGWKEASSPVLRGRDFILVIAACVLAVGIRPRGVPFPGVPVLGEIAGSSMPSVAHAAWTRATSATRAASPRADPRRGPSGPR